jgi:hypothetical protein
MGYATVKNESRSGYRGEKTICIGSGNIVSDAIVEWWVAEV